MKKILFIIGLLLYGVSWGQTPTPTVVTTGQTNLNLQETHRPPGDRPQGVNDAPTRVRPGTTGVLPPSSTSEGTQTTGTSAGSGIRTQPTNRPQPQFNNRPSAAFGRQTGGSQQPCPCNDNGNRLSGRELTLYFGEGVQGIYYNINNGGISKMGTGLNFGAAYTYFVHNNVAVTGGLGLSFYNTTAALPTLYYYSPKQRILYGDAYYIERFISGYTEQQSVMTLNVPITVQYVSDYKFYIKGGVQMGIPLSATYSGSNANILQGYQFELPSGYLSGMIYDKLETPDPNMRIEAGDFPMASVSDYMKVKFSLILSIEAGLRLEIFPKNYLYTGIYFDYGVNNFVVKNDNEFIRELTKSDANDNPNFTLYNFRTNSLLNSTNPSTTRNPGKTINGWEAKPLGTPFVSKSHLMGFGIKLSYAFSIMPMVTTSLGDGGESAPRVLSPWENIANKLDVLLSRQNELAQTSSITREKSEKTTIVKEAPQKAAPKKMTKKTRLRYLRVIREPIVGFDPRQVTLSADQKVKLNKKATALRQLPDVKVTLYGYTSNLGGESLGIGLKRAQAAKNYLVKKGVKKNNISVVSRGAESPLVPNTNAENRKTNSRIEILEK
jgi:outer membrane protein OmpA-like peptidoglycan-associated protein